MEGLESYTLNIGKLWVNLASLEFILRAFISRKTGQEHISPKLEELREGEKVKESWMTNYASLGKLIEKFNSLPAICIPINKDRVLKVRDTLAHGRISSDKPGLPMKIIKFGQPKNGQVTTEIVVETSNEWFKKERRYLYALLHNLKDLYSKLA